MYTIITVSAHVGCHLVRVCDSVRDCETQPSHDGGGEASRSRNGDDPGENDVPKDGPVDVVSRSHTAREDDRPDLEITYDTI